VRISRKHIGWYINPLPGGREFTRVFNTLETTAEQQHSLRDFFIGYSDQEQVA
jgi:tRNA-dihydrouridine synthase B